MKTIALIVMLALIPNMAFAGCDFSTGIAEVPGGYLYTSDCHRAVGKMKNDLGVTQTQVSDLGKAVDFKDIALQKSDERVSLWRDTSLKMEDKLIQVDSLQSKNNWLYFGLGVLATIGAGYVASQVYRR